MSPSTCDPSLLRLLRALRFSCFSFSHHYKAHTRVHSSTSTKGRKRSLSPSNHRCFSLSMTRLCFIPPFSSAPPPQRQTLSPSPCHYAQLPDSLQNPLAQFLSTPPPATRSLPPVSRPFPPNLSLSINTPLSQHPPSSLPTPISSFSAPPPRLQR